MTFSGGLPYFSSGLCSDPELAAAIAGELRRQQEGVELIASENIVSRLVLEAQGSILTNQTVEGLPYARYCGGAEFTDAIEARADERMVRVNRGVRTTPGRYGENRVDRHDNPSLWEDFSSRLGERRPLVGFPAV